MCLSEAKGMDIIMNLCYNCFQEKPERSGPCPFCGFDLAENVKKYPVALPAGTLLNGRYIIGRVLGQGGFGITYLAWDTQLEAKVAVKEYMPGELAGRIDGTTVSVLSDDRKDNFTYGAERFREEAKTLAKFIGNPNIAAVTSYFDENDTSYFVMDYVEGISFKTYIANQGGKVSVEEALDVMVPVLRALTAVHAEGLIHRDVTPDNIYITKDGNVKLLDFGSARYSIGDKSKSLDVILKVGYAPKEQYIRRSRQGPYKDVYSCAACFYAVITGYLPPESLERLDKDTLVSPSQMGIEIPLYLERAILKGLAVQPEDRFQNAQEFLEAIENQQVVEVKSPEAKEQKEETPKRKIPAAAMGAVAAVVVLAAVGTGYLAARGSGEEKLAAAWTEAAMEAGGQLAAEAGGDGIEAETEEPARDVKIGDQVYPSNLEELDLADAGLSNEDLAALSEMTNLTDLSLEENYDITDLSPLSSLTSLKTLDIKNTGATDLTPLKGLTNLEELKMANPDISDLTPLKDLTNLRILMLDDGDLPSSAITDLSPLAGLVNLETLSIPPQPNYTDFSCLSGLTNLKVFRMMGTKSSGTNSVSSLDFLANMTQLEELRIVVAAGDLSVLAGLTNLRSVSLDGTLHAPDTGIFRNLTKLEDLTLRGGTICSAEDLSDFSNLTSLHTLVIDLDGLSSLHGLENLTGLTELELNCRSSSITDLSPLANMKNLVTLRLYAGSGPAINVEALGGLANLRTVEIGPAGRIGDTSALAHVPDAALRD